MPQDQTTQRIAEILSRVKQLPSANLEPPQFFANFLQLTAAAIGAKGGAVWLTQSEQGPQCYCHIDLETCGINESEEQKRLVIEAVMRTVKEAKPIVIPPAGNDPTDSVTSDGSDVAPAGSTTNKSSCPFFFIPLRAANQVAMVLQIIGAESLSAHDYRTVVALLTQAAESADNYLANRRATVLDDDRKSLAQLLQYAEAVHGSLNHEKVVFQIANLGRDTIGCTRLVVWVDPKVKRRLFAVSGVDKADRRAVLMQSLEKLSKHCLEIKKPIVASREQLVEMPEDDKLTILLKDYFNISNLDQIFLQPIINKEDYLGVLIAEGFEEAAGANHAGVIATVAKHAAVALANALEMAAVPLVRPLGKLKAVKKDPKKKQKYIAILLIIIAALVVGLLMPWTVKIEGACRLTPLERRVVDVPLDGVKIAEVVTPEGFVEKGALIARLDDEELSNNLLAYQAQRAQAQNDLSQAVSMASTENQEKFRLEVQRLDAFINLMKLQISKCQLLAPISGTILTPQLQLKTGMTVNRGDMFCEIANLDKWELVLEVPQEEIFWVQRRLKEESAETKFFLEAYPEYKLTTNITDVDQISQVPQIHQELGNVYEIRVEVDEQELAEIQLALRDGITGRAKISTQERALGYVLLRKVIRFFRITFF